MTGDDYDLLLHCTIGHMHSLDGAEPDFENGEKTLYFKLLARSTRNAQVLQVIWHIHILHIYHILHMHSVFNAHTHFA